MNTQSKNHERVFGFKTVRPHYLVVPMAEVAEVNRHSGTYQVILDRWWLAVEHDDGQFGLLFHVPAYRSDGGLRKAAPVYPMCNPNRAIADRLVGPTREFSGLDLVVQHVPVALVPKREDGAMVFGVEFIREYTQATVS